MRKSSAVVLALFLSATEGAKLNTERHHHHHHQRVQALSQAQSPHCAVCDVIANSIVTPYNPPARHQELSSLEEEMKNPYKDARSPSLDWKAKNGFAMAQQSEPWGHPHSSTGAAIPICNGANAGSCTEASEVVKHKLRRPFKRAAPGDPDYVEDPPAAPRDPRASFAQQTEPWGHPHSGTGDAIPICNGANAGACTEASEVVKHKLRRPFKRAAPGDPDYVEDAPAPPMIPVAGDYISPSGSDLTPIALVQMPWGTAHQGTGDVIAICNGGNDGHCVEAAEVVKHRLRRAGKMPGRGDPDDPEVLAANEKKAAEKLKEKAEKTKKAAEEPAEGEAKEEKKEEGKEEEKKEESKEESKEEAKEEKKADAKEEKKADAKEEKKADAKEEGKADAKEEGKADAKEEKKAEAKEEKKAESKEEETKEAKPEKKAAKTEKKKKAPAKKEKADANASQIDSSNDDELIGMTDNTTGPVIAICNGGNDGACTEAADVVLHTLRRPGRMAGPGDPDEIITPTKKDLHPAILEVQPNQAIANMRAGFVQTDAQVTLRSASNGAPFASIPDSLEFLQMRDIGLVQGDAEDQKNYKFADSDPTGLTSDLLQIHTAEPWGSPHGGGTGGVIAICNGLNAHHCTEAADVVRHRLRRPGKRAAPGDPDYVDDLVADPALSLAQHESQKKTASKEPVTTTSGSDVALSDHVKRELGFEDDGGITSDMNLQIEEKIRHLSGSLMTICNGRNGPSCVEPIDVFAKHRRPESRPAVGDSDYVDENALEQKIEFPAFLSTKGKGTPIPHYSDMVDDHMSWDLQKNVLNSDYDDHGLTEDYDMIQTGHKWGQQRLH